MIKSEQIEDLNREGFRYITTVTNPQIKRLLKTGVIQIELFDQQLVEVKTSEDIRYVLRRNPIRTTEVARSRQDRLQAVQREANRQNLYLGEHRWAQVEVA